MKNYGKYIKSFMLMTLIMILHSQIAFATENCKEFNIKDKVSITKAFYLSFTEDINEGDFSENITVEEAESSLKVPVKLTTESLKTKLKIQPIGAYDFNKSYKIIIDKNFTSKKGRALAKPVIVNFTTVSSDASITTFEQYYSLLKKALENCDTTLKLNVKNFDPNTFKLETISEIIKKYPDITMGYNGAEATTVLYEDNTAMLEIKFKYSDTKENILKKKQMVNEEIERILKSIITSNMNDLQKEKVIHDYIVNHTKYDQRLFTGNMPLDSYSEYGVFVNKTAVCQGYALAMYKLLKACNIEVYMVTGEAYSGNKWGGHSWNLVKIDGIYHHIDATWDDPITKDLRDILSYDYFNVSDNVISKNHRWDYGLYPTAK